MDILECINTRRSVRSYAEKDISDETISELLNLAVKAATGSNAQPWGFVVIKDKEKIKELSKSVKEYVINNLDEMPYFKQYEDYVKNDKTDLLFGSPCLILIYGNTESHWYKYDCTLAASNIILAANSMDIGTCWIGFCEKFCNLDSFKKEHNVPKNYELVSVLTLGYKKRDQKPLVRKEPNIFFNA